MLPYHNWDLPYLFWNIHNGTNSGTDWITGLGVLVALFGVSFQVIFWFYDRHKETEVDNAIKELLISEIKTNIEKATYYLERINKLKENKTTIGVIGLFPDTVFNSIINSHRAVRFLSKEMVEDLFSFYSNVQSINKAVEQTLKWFLSGSSIRSALKEDLLKDWPQIKSVSGVKNINFNSLADYPEVTSWVTQISPKANALIDKLSKL